VPVVAGAAAAAGGEHRSARREPAPPGAAAAGTGTAVGLTKVLIVGAVAGALVTGAGGAWLVRSRLSHGVPAPVVAATARAPRRRFLEPEVDLQPEPEPAVAPAPDEPSTVPAPAPPPTTCMRAGR